MTRQILDRGIKANFEIRIYSKKKKKTVVVSYYSDEDDLESLRKKIKEALSK